MCFFFFKAETGKRGTRRDLDSEVVLSASAENSWEFICGMGSGVARGWGGGGGGVGGGGGGGSKYTSKCMEISQIHSGAQNLDFSVAKQ